MAEQLHEADHSGELCTRCGMCCSGVLFAWVPVPAEDRDRITGLGFRIEKAEDEERFAQPCRMFNGQICTVYADRPGPCARYRCELLKKVDGGEVSLSDAKDLVAQAKHLLEEISPLLGARAEGTCIGQQWALRFNEWQSRESEGRRDESEARLLLKMTLLNQLLDRYFRTADQRPVMEE